MFDFFYSRRFRYLVVGGVNTIFGYMIGVSVYEMLSKNFSVWTIGVISNLIGITFSFVTYKLFVFQTRGRWLSEYIKAYFVYGGMALFGVVLLWFYIEICGLSIWLAQAITIASTVFISYIGHAKFTFRHQGI